MSSFEKAAIRWENTTKADAFHILLDLCCIDGKTAKSIVLPTRNIDAVNRGGLKYTSLELFKIVCVIEYFFVSVLTNENLLIYGGHIIHSVMSFLEKNSLINCKIRDIFEDEIIEDDILSYIVLIF